MPSRVRITSVVLPRSPQRNPAELKPVSQITDRAKRYRANRNPPPGEKRCAFCYSRKNLGVHHAGGNESINTAAEKLWACKSCNGKVGHVLRRANIGKLTRQFNPRKSVPSMAEYGNAIKVMRGDFAGDVRNALATIRATPAHVRSTYTAQSWKTRKNKYGPSGRQGKLFGDSEVPF